MFTQKIALACSVAFVAVFIAAAPLMFTVSEQFDDIFSSAVVSAFGGDSGGGDGGGGGPGGGGPGEGGGFGGDSGGGDGGCCGEGGNGGGFGGDSGGGDGGCCDTGGGGSAPAAPAAPSTPDPAPAAVPGCTNPAANNFNAAATVNNGSCAFDVPGCTDATANNFNAAATIDNGSCAFDVPGCTDATASNFNAAATIDNGSCTFVSVIPGCTDATASNFNAAANLDDGTCVFNAPTPVCTSFTANGQSGALTLDAAGDVTLAWTTTNATQVEIDNGVGVFTAVNSDTLVGVTSGPITFTLIPSDAATNGTACTVTVDIDDGGGGGGSDFTCESNVVFNSDRNPVGTGNLYTLSWNVTDADTVSINEGIGLVQAIDSLQLTAPDDDTTINYVLTATNGSDTISCDLPIQIDGGGGGGGGGSSAPRCEFLASDRTISVGEEITLSWDTSRTNDITIFEGDPDDGNDIFQSDDDDEVDEGSITVRPRSDTTYTLVAERGSRDTECDVDVVIDDGVVVLENRAQEPRVAGIALTQVPHTGFEAGPVLTFIFYALLAIWGAFVAYFFVLKRTPEVAATGNVLDQDEFEKKVQRLTAYYTGRNLM